MRNPLRRYYGRGDLHFITFSCYRRRRYLGTHRARHRSVKVLEQVRSQFRFLLIGYVVMPEHVHLLVSEPKKGNPSKALQVLKQRVPAPCASRRENRRRSYRWLSLQSRMVRHFGSAASMTLTCGAREKHARNWTICTEIQCSANLSRIPGTGRGAVWDIMKEERQV